MAEFLRQLVEENVCFGGNTTDLGKLSGAVKGGSKTNFARDKRRIVEDAYSSTP